MHEHRHLGWLVGCALAASGCTSFIEGGAGGTGGATTTPPGVGGGSAGGGVSSASGASSSAGATAQGCGAPQAPALHARLLSPSQYEHAVEDLVKVTSHPAKEFGRGVAAQLDEVEVERRANAANAIASDAAKSLAAWAPCMPAADPAPCRAQLIDALGRAAFRHPLSNDERVALEALFDAGLKEKDFATGVEWLLAGLFQAPDFLYQLARPAAGERAGQVVPLGAYELASRLALFVWDSLPDPALQNSAESGKLADAQGLASELTRLLADARFGRGIEGFYSDWLGLDGFAEVARDDAGLTSEVNAALRQSLLMSATELYSAAAPNIAELLSGDGYFLNADLRTFYGLPAGDAQFSRTQLPNQGRHGVLTHPALMALLARPKESNPIARGLFVQRTVLCNDIPPPPAGVVIPPLPPAMDGLSTRARLERHTATPLCSSCHDMIDPPGFALENYDAVGRYRAMDAGVPVDTSGALSGGTELDGAFASGEELLGRIATSALVKTCFAKHYLTYAVAREVATEDACSVSSVAEKFGQTGDLRQLVQLIASSDSFRLRATEDGGPP